MQVKQCNQSIPTSPVVSTPVDLQLLHIKIWHSGIRSHADTEVLVINLYWKMKRVPGSLQSDVAWRRPSYISPSLEAPVGQQCPYCTRPPATQTREQGEKRQTVSIAGLHFKSDDHHLQFPSHRSAQPIRSNSKNTAQN